MDFSIFTQVRKKIVKKWMKKSVSTDMFGITLERVISDIYILRQKSKFDTFWSHIYNYYKLE